MSEINDKIKSFYIPEFKSMGLNIKGVTEKEEYDKYISVATECGAVDKIKEYIPDTAISVIPVCVLSYEYNESKSFGLKMILKESRIHDLNRRYIIFTNKSKINTYDVFKNIKNIEIHEVPDEVNSLVLKRQYILDWAYKNDIENIFMLEDDVGEFSIPVLSTTNNGFKKNIKFIISNNYAFDLWEYFIIKNDFKFTGLKTTMAFDFHTTDKDLMNFYEKIKDCIQIIHVNVKTAFENNIKYDPNSGWDDYDFELQWLTKHIINYAMFMTYITPPLKSGISTHSNLEERCKVNTEKLINKWGDLVKVDSRKGLYNAKLNWNKIKKLYKPEEISNDSSIVLNTNKVKKVNKFIF